MELTSNYFSIFRFFHYLPFFVDPEKSGSFYFFLGLIVI